MEEKELVRSFPGLLKDLNYTQWSNSATPVMATMMLDEAITFVGSEFGDPNFATSEDLAVAVLVSSSASGWEADVVKLPESKNYAFRYGHETGRVSFSGAQALVYQVQEEDIGSPDDVVASITPWPRAWQQEEADPANWRGTFYPTYQRKVLFSKTMTLQTASLPQWKPRATIELRTFESENDQ